MASAEPGKDRVAASIAQGWRWLKPEAWDVDPSHVRRVCVILSAPRSGSSFLFHLLSKHPDFVAPLGEDTPFFRLMGLGCVGSFEESDAIDPVSVDPSVVRELACWILRDCSGGETARDVACRLLLQWPVFSADPEKLLCSVTKALESSSPPEALEALARELPEIQTALYDGKGGAIPLERSCFFEEPPFVVPKGRASVESFDGKILLLKTSTNAYRIPLILKLFPKAEYRFILLSRNPMGSINGLIDGWRSGGFHSHRLDAFGDLSIEGYTRPDDPSTRAWWKFDLPPGWAAKTRSSLPEVCSFQWTAANQAILGNRKLLGDALEVKYESLLHPRNLGAELEGVLDLLGASPYERSLLLKTRADSIMSVIPPASGRWKARRGVLLPLLEEHPMVRATAEAMGYDLEKPEGLA